MNLKLFQGRYIMIFLHISAWVILVGLPIYFINRWNVSSDFIWLYYINLFINGLIFYCNYFMLIPRFFYSTKKYKYYLLTLLLMVCLYFVSDISNRLVFQYISNNRPAETVQVRPEVPRQQMQGNSQGRRPPVTFTRFRRPPFRLMHIYNYALSALVITFFSLGLRGLERNVSIEKRQKELEKEKLNSELAFLKNQISPHFFFNTLNNIYSLIGINTEDSKKAVLQLSKMMRYLLYESEQGETSMSSEIEFMNNYIELMRLRMSDKVKLEVSFPKKHENITIPPLLFIPIIENAFKHGVSYREKSFIQIDMKVSKELINFNCTNSVVKIGNENSKEHSGIGLENLKKRLSLLFPDKHELTIENRGSDFSVSVRINLL